MILSYLNKLECERSQNLSYILLNAVMITLCLNYKNNFKICHIYNKIIKKMDTIDKDRDQWMVMISYYIIHRIPKNKSVLERTKEEYAVKVVFKFYGTGAQAYCIILNNKTDKEAGKIKKYVLKTIKSCWILLLPSKKWIYDD